MPLMTYFRACLGTGTGIGLIAYCHRHKKPSVAIARFTFNASA